MAIPVVLRANSGALTVDLTAGVASTDVAGTINTTWAGWSGTSSATVEHPAIITATWAGWDGEAVGTVTGGDEPPAEDTPPSGAFIRQRPRPPIAPVAINDDDEVLLLLAL